MTVSKRSDQIFQLSLTEIAFTIAFILLLLLGYLVSRETSARQIAEQKLAKVQELEIAQKSFDEASKRLQEGLAGTGIVNPEEIISNLIANAKAEAERDRLLIKVQDLEAVVSSLSEVKQMASDAASGAGMNAVVDRVVSALAMQAEVEDAIDLANKEGLSNADKRLERPTPEQARAEVRRAIEVMSAIDKALRDADAQALPAGNEAETVASMIQAAQSLRSLDGTNKGVQTVLKENADLRGQMANMRKKFDAIGRGLDHAPCWTDEAGNIEYLFKVELDEGSIVVLPDWPDRRSKDAAQLPGVSELTSGPLSPERFRSASKLILDIGKRQDPQCRHFVKIDNKIEARRQADQARLMVENFFYKLEIGR